jgi:hypothetical protein
MLHKAFRLATILGVIALLLSVGSRVRADVVIHTPPGLSVGDTFRIVFVTDGTPSAISSSIAHYNSIVTAEAGGVTYNGVTVT